MVRDVGIRDPFTYSGFIAFELWLYYLDGIAPEDSLIRYIKRIVIIRVNSKYSHLSVEIREDLVQSALTEIWRAASRKKLPSHPELPYTERVNIWHQILNTIIDRRFARAFQTIYDDAPKNLTIDVYDRPYLRRFTSKQQIEDAIYLGEELPKVLIRDVLKHLRFEDPGFRAAAAYVVDRIIHQQRIVRNWIKRRYKVTNYKFLTEHVLILVRAYLYEIRTEALERYGSSEDSPLEAFFTEHFAS